MKLLLADFSDELCIILPLLSSQFPNEHLLVLSSCGEDRVVLKVLLNRNNGSSMLIKGLLEVVVWVVQVSWAVLNGRARVLLDLKHSSLDGCFCLLSCVIEDLNGAIIKTCDDNLLCTLVQGNMLDTLHTIGNLNVILLL